MIGTELRLDLMGIPRLLRIDRQRQAVDMKWTFADEREYRRETQQKYQIRNALGFHHGMVTNYSKKKFNLQWEV